MHALRDRDRGKSDNCRRQEALARWAAGRARAFQVVEADGDVTTQGPDCGNNAIGIRGGLGISGVQISGVQNFWGSNADIEQNIF